MRRTALLLAVMAAALVLANGMALAKTTSSAPTRWREIVGTKPPTTSTARGATTCCTAMQAADKIRGGDDNDQAIWRLGQRHYLHPGRLQGPGQLRQRHRHGLPSTPRTRLWAAKGKGEVGRGTPRLP